MRGNYYYKTNILLKFRVCINIVVPFDDAHALQPANANTYIFAKYIHFNLFKNKDRKMNMLFHRNKMTQNCHYYRSLRFGKCLTT